ncbi:Aspartyl-tRNA synthetase [Cladobotryum mycophilum]|uniref:Aspartyl-tRNA synthetase n=1 Tax=Cladobotryum mycophilum TaxID=491253 RepID=A0ABR0SJU7_9HYPO
MRPHFGRFNVTLRRNICLNAVISTLPRQCLLGTTRTYAKGIKPIPAGHVNDARRKELRNLWNKYHGVDGPSGIGEDGVCVGLIGKRRNVSKHLSFADLTMPSGEVIQLCSSNEKDEAAHRAFREIPGFSPVIVQIKELETPETTKTTNARASKPTAHIEGIRQLNSVPNDLIITPEVQFPPTHRHLQIRFHPELQARLRFRSWLKGVLNQGLLEKGFIDVETPTLFKSTTEGAREFLVPSRIRGHAYALSQSPQQYKQVLMASGISRYMQWARCFRDEDLRADRQPEFSQLDMEWAFAGAETVKRDINDIVLKALAALRSAHSYKNIRGEIVPVVSDIPHSSPATDEPVAHQFTNITFAESIAAYGTDKPDLRIPLRIHAIEDLEQYSEFVSKIAHLENPLIEAFALPLQNCNPLEARKLITKFMNGLPPALRENPDGKPQVLIHDFSQPLNGFSSVGFEYESILDKLSEGNGFNDGDLVIFQAREKPVGQYCSGSTKIGEIRNMLWKAAVDAGYMKTPQLGEPGSLQFAWVTEFPMFKPVEEGEPGQGSPAGVAAAHHPFTAPLSQNDLELLFTDPMQAKSAAYDLVLNGIEIGGGSVRNHIVQIQEFIMRDVLKMQEDRIQEFSHLFEALRSGCPPHAGFALGFDRLVALMSGTPTVRDVIAFPKSMKGEDLFVRSPGKLYNEQLEPYGLLIRSGFQRASMNKK